MPRCRSAKKRLRQNEKRRMRNRFYKTRVKNVIKKVRLAISNKSLEDAKKAMAEAIPIIFKAASKGVIHRRNAARKVSRLGRQLNMLEKAVGT